MTKDAPSAEDLDTQALWERIDRETQEETATGPSSSGRQHSRQPRAGRRATRRRSRESSLRTAVWTGAVTAVVAVTVALWLFAPLKTGVQDASSAPETITTKKGQRTSVRLTDGSRVRLNVDSRLTIPPSFGEKRREVHLEGEAFFEVAGDSMRPFIVRTEGATTRVLGTAFDVGAYPEDDEIKVAVTEGRVRLQAESSTAEKASPAGEESANEGTDRQENRRDVVLTKNHVSLISQGGETITRREQDLSEHLAWLDGQLAFEDASFEEVTRKLERWYGLEIEFQGGASLPSGHLNAQFDEDRPLSDVLRVVGAAFGLKYHRDENKVTFVTAH
jgi:ferric-dicitrate binding protein FerR (iron transport regulator)